MTIQVRYAGHKRVIQWLLATRHTQDLRCDGSARLECLSVALCDHGPQMVHARVLYQPQHRPTCILSQRLLDTKPTFETHMELYHLSDVENSVRTVCARAWNIEVVTYSGAVLVADHNRGPGSRCADETATNSTCMFMIVVRHCNVGQVLMACDRCAGRKLVSQQSLKSIAQVPTQLLRFQVSEIQLLRLKVNCSGYDQLLRSQLLRLIQLLRLAAIAQVY